MSLLSTFTSVSINGWTNNQLQNGYLQQSIIIPSPIGADYYFGSICAISGDNNYCVIGGNPRASDNAFYVFINNYDGTWTQQVRIAGSGNQVAINATGNYIVIGNSGSIRIYNRSGSTWTLQQTITGTGAFGYVCAIDSTGTRIATANPQNNSNRGAAYIYVRTGATWSLEATLIATGAAVNNFNGFSISINSDGSYVTTGAPGYNSEQGAIYVFNRTGTIWGQQQRISGFLIGQTSEAGRVISINATGNYLIFSAPSTGIPPFNSYVHIYSRTGTTWSLQQTLSANNIFGWALSMNGAGDIAIINQLEINSYTGKILIYNRVGSTWNLIQEVITNPSQTFSGLTNRNALDINDLGTWFIGGAENMNTYGSNSGTTFIFSNL